MYALMTMTLIHVDITQTLAHAHTNQSLMLRSVVPNEVSLSLSLSLPSPLLTHTPWPHQGPHTDPPPLHPVPHIHHHHHHYQPPRLFHVVSAPFCQREWEKERRETREREARAWQGQRWSPVHSVNAKVHGVE